MAVAGIQSQRQWDDEYEKSKAEKDRSKAELLSFLASKGLKGDFWMAEELSESARRLNVAKMLGFLKERPDLLIAEITHSHLGVYYRVGYSTDRYSLNIDELVIAAVSQNWGYADHEMNFVAWTLVSWADTFNFSVDASNAILKAILRYEDPEEVGRGWVANSLVHLFFKEGVDKSLIHKVAVERAIELGFNILSPNLDPEVVKNYGSGPKFDDLLALALNPYSTEEAATHALKRIDSMEYYSNSEHAQLNPERYETFYRVVVEQFAWATPKEKRQRGSVVGFLLSNLNTPRHILKNLHDLNRFWRGEVFAAYPELNRKQLKKGGVALGVNVANRLDNYELLSEIVDIHLNDELFCDEILTDNPRLPEDLVFKMIKRHPSLISQVTLENKGLSVEFLLYLEYKNLYPVYDANEKEEFEQRANTLLTEIMRSDVAEIPISYLMAILSMQLDIGSIKK